MKDGENPADVTSCPPVNPDKAVPSYSQEVIFYEGRIQRHLTCNKLTILEG